MIPESEIPECPEHEVKSKIGNIFVNEKILEEYSVKIYKIDPYFCEHYKEKIQVDNNVCEYILSRIDVIFLNIFQLQKLMKKKHVDRDLIFEEKRQKELEFIGINMSKEGYDADYEASRIETSVNLKTDN